MLDDLKKDRHIGFGAQERLKLSLYVAGLLVLGGVIFMGTQTGGCTGKISEEPPAAVPAKDAANGGGTLDLGPMLAAEDVRRLAEEERAAPDRWSDRALEHILDTWRRGRIPPPTKRIGVDGFHALGPDARGRVYEVTGTITEMAVEAWTPREDSTGNERLWTIVLEGPSGIPALALKYGNQSDVGEGVPFDEKPPGVRSERLEPGQHVVVRGVFVQRRRGSFGDTAVMKPAPVLLGTHWRIVVPPEDRNPVISGLDEALWGDVHDRFNRESRKWDEDALYEVIQWARAQGYEKLRDQIESGKRPWIAWERGRFERWKKEVAVDEDTPRPISEGSRGKLFRISGIIGELFDFGWEDLPRNSFGIDEMQGLMLLSDHYQNVALRVFLPWPLTTFEGVTGAREEHLRLYGIYIKNLTYDTKHKRDDGTDRLLPVTVPMFVVLHGEPYPEEEAGAAMRNAMLWVAVAMVVFGLLFYVVLIRGGAKQAQRMEEHRLALRKRIREKGQGAQLPEKGAPNPPEDGA